MANAFYDHSPTALRPPARRFCSRCPKHMYLTKVRSEQLKGAYVVTNTFECMSCGNMETEEKRESAAPVYA